MQQQLLYQHRAEARLGKKWIESDEVTLIRLVSYQWLVGTLRMWLRSMSRMPIDRSVIKVRGEVEDVIRVDSWDVVEVWMP